MTSGLCLTSPDFPFTTMPVSISLKTGERDSVIIKLWWKNFKKEVFSEFNIKPDTFFKGKVKKIFTNLLKLYRPSKSFKCFKIFIQKYQTSF